MSRGRSATSIIWRTVVYAGAMLAAPGCPHSSSTCVEEPVAQTAVDTSEPEPLPAEYEPALEGRVTLTVVSTPGGGDVYLNGDAAGKTPFRTTVPIGAEVAIQVIRDGYATGEQTVTADADQTASIELQPLPVAARSRCTNEGRRGRGFVLS
jgi:hypothetical protein